jgi:hypothetical protein
MKIDKLSGPLYKHLGHFSQERWVREGHNFMDWVDEMIGASKSDPNKVDPKIEAARKAKAKQMESDAKLGVYRDDKEEAGKGED